MNWRGIVVLTGAGISRESGLSTFRDADGIWAKVRIEDVATPEAFARDPASVQAFYDARRVQLRDPGVQPNAAHRALVRLAREYPGPVLVVTQNVDDLHDRAGQPALLHMHGELAKAQCLHCGAVSPFEGAGLAAAFCPACGARALRPYVVWFGEIPMHIEEIEEALEACGLFAAIGTSGQVYPAAGYAETARAHGARTVELNLEPTTLTCSFDHARHGPATEVVPAWVDEVLSATRDRR
ncbi:MAG: NAD-dependent deacylase [Acetobacteraceae bacterium]|nr:NAD-dependent deacylase [Acetobacteraceae bacterium]MBV8522259.1 NAD-dependent deacylase [Acetobacteraceae bacterium]